MSEQRDDRSDRHHNRPAGSGRDPARRRPPQRASYLPAAPRRRPTTGDNCTADGQPQPTVGSKARQQPASTPGHQPAQPHGPGLNGHASPAGAGRQPIGFRRGNPPAQRHAAAAAAPAGEPCEAATSAGDASVPAAVIDRDAPAQGDLPRPVQFAMAAMVVLLGAAASFILVSTPGPGAGLTWPGFASVAVNAAVSSHAIVVIALAPLIVFTGLRGDRVFGDASAFLSALCLALLVAILATNVASWQSPPVIIGYVALLALQSLVLPYILLTRRFGQPSRAAAQRHGRRLLRATGTGMRRQIANARRGSVRLANAAAGLRPRRIDTIPCPRCGEPVDRQAKDCESCGLHDIPGLLAHAANSGHSTDTENGNRRGGIGNLLQRPTRADRRS